MCAEGHAGPDAPDADPPLGGRHLVHNHINGIQPPNPPPAPAASIADLQNILHQMLNFQNTSLHHPPQTSTGQNRSKTKPERPKIKQNSSDGDWQLYLDSWRRYKQMCKLTDATEIRNELRCTCTQDVNQLLFDIVGPEQLDLCTEAELLSYIKSVAVQGSHKEVHRQKFQTLKQDKGQLITSFLAKLKSQAQLCDFNVTCTNPLCLRSVSYATNMVAGQLIAGLYNTEHQARILAEAASLTTLKSKYDRLVSLETTDIATKRLNTTVAQGPSSSNAMMAGNRRSQRPRRRGGFQQQQNRQQLQRIQQHQRQQQPQQQQHQPQMQPQLNPPVFACKGCGETSHPSGRTM